MERDAVIAQARAVYEQHQDQELARSPLAGMAEWVASGVAPPAAELRGLGLTCAGIDQATSERLRLARKAFTRHWGFSIPGREAVEALLNLGPLLEVGAGTGYWSSLLQSAGGDVIASDPAPRANPHGFETGRYAGIVALDAREAIEAYADRSVFCSWPTEGEAWAAEAFGFIRPGLHLALIGTDRGGITGDTALFDLLEAAFSIVQELAIPQFPNVDDRLRIFRRH